MYLGTWGCLNRDEEDLSELPEGMLYFCISIASLSNEVKEVKSIGLSATEIL